MPPRLPAWTGILLSVLVAPLAAQRVELQVFLGSAISAPSPLTISQDGQPDIHFTAHWATRPTESTRYFAWRIGLWRGNRGWALDHTHHKIYLTNFPPEVQAFRITNGVNMLTLSRTFRHGPFSYSFGAGPVFAFPISTIRGKKLTHDRGVGGYVLWGGSLMVMATRRFRLVRGLSLSLDARASASYLRVPVVEGHAAVPLAALHLHAGLGYGF